MQSADTGYLLVSRAELEQVARDAADHAMRAGVDQVMASASEMGGIVMRARGGAFESATREGRQSLTIRVFEGGRTGSASTEALDRNAINLAVEHAIAIARAVEPDPDAAPPEPEWLARSAPEIQMFEPSGLSAEQLGRTAMEIEALAIERGDGRVRVSQAGAASIDGCSALAIGRDFDRSQMFSTHNSWCAALAENQDGMTQDMWSSSDRRLSQLLPASVVATTAADRALRKLGGRTLDTRSCPALFDAVVAVSLVQDIIGALSGQPQYQGSTFFPDARGSTVVASHLDLFEDPYEPFGLESGTCDSEGMASVPRSIISQGVAQELFLSCLYARKLGLRPTGNADGVRNLRLTSSLAAEPLDQMLRRMNQGLWVTELIGGAVDPVSGAYSKAAAGFWIENGEVAFPVQDITIAGDLPDMLRHVVALGADVHRSGAVRTGSVLIENMRISGR